MHKKPLEICFYKNYTANAILFNKQIYLYKKEHLKKLAKYEFIISAIYCVHCITSR